MAKLSMRDFYSALEQKEIEKDLAGFTPDDLEAFWSHDPFTPYPKASPKPPYKTMREKLFRRMWDYLSHPERLPEEYHERAYDHTSVAPELLGRHLKKSKTEITDMIRQYLLPDEYEDPERFLQAARGICMKNDIMLPDMWIYYVFGIDSPPESSSDQKIHVQPVQERA